MYLRIKDLKYYIKKKLIESVQFDCIARTAIKSSMLLDMPF